MFFTVGGVQDEVRPVHVNMDFADVHDYALDDVRDRIRPLAPDFDLCGRGVDVKRETDHDSPQIKRTDLRAGDRDDRQRRAVIRAREIDLAGSSARARYRRPRSRSYDRFHSRPDMRVQLLLGAALFLAACIVGVWAERDPRQVARQPRRQYCRESA